MNGGKEVAAPRRQRCRRRHLERPERRFARLCMSLQGRLLVALPHLLDPNFRSSVVLILEDHEEGSVGLVLNRPTKIQTTNVVREFGFEWSGEPRHSSGPLSETVYRGGPVQPEMVWLLHGEGPEIPGSVEVLPDCWYTASLAGLEALADRPSRRRRFFVGYAGWGAGQLDDELREGAWLPVPADSELLFDAAPKDLWELALRNLGIDPGALIAPNGLVH